MDGWDPSTMMEPSMNTSDAEEAQEEGDGEELEEVRSPYYVISTDKTLVLALSK